MQSTAATCALQAAGSRNLPWAVGASRGRPTAGASELHALPAADDGSIECQVLVDPNPFNFRFVVRDGKIADHVWYDPIVPVPKRVYARLMAETAAHLATGWKPKGVWDVADISVKPRARQLAARK